MSFWMSEDETIQYKHCLTLPREEMPPKWLIPMAYRNIQEEAPTPKTIVNNTKNANRRKRRSTFGEIDTPTVSSAARAAQAKAPTPGTQGKSQLETNKRNMSMKKDQLTGPQAAPAMGGAGSTSVPVLEPAVTQGVATQSAKNPANSTSKIPYDVKYAAAESFG